MKRHHGRIHRPGASLLDAFLFQRLWDAVDNQGKTAGWSPSQFKARIDELLHEYDTGKVVPDWRGELPMPIGTRAFDPVRDQPYLTSNKKTSGLDHLTQWRQHCASQNLDVRLVPRQYEQVLHDMLNMRVSSSHIGVQVPVTHSEVSWLSWDLCNSLCSV